ncbi:hypothetical protein Moror_6526 [Moniliophthora roreri MCA 2997]|uniref:Uncharacterized protein n=1 Tax=Moniliophthora roreri (strain MCA 2997) TaxID=1381753 RepID=V2XCN0_MONRO|nr:hypothetical protein Moror_6526 [Moniliophthora roreri MCA 2997]
MNGRCRPVDPDSDAMRGYSTKDKANKDHCMSVDALRSLHYYPTCFARDMCYYLVDGRLWACGHFEPMSSSHQDCLKSTCLFSSAHPLGCRSTNCMRTMQLPVRNPIRVFKIKCTDCLSRGGLRRGGGN